MLYSDTSILTQHIWLGNGTVRVYGGFAMDTTGQTDQRFITNLRLARERAGLSQEGLAERMNERGYTAFRQQTITRIENGHRKVSLEEAVQLAQAVGSTADALSRPAGLARDAWAMLRDVQVIRDAHKRAAAAAEEFRITQVHLRGLMKRLENEGAAPLLEVEMSAARRALALSLEHGESA